MSITSLSQPTNKLDRRIIYLEEKCTFEEYKARLGAIKYNEKVDSYSKSITFYYDLDWNSIAPNSMHNFEQSVELTTSFGDFIKNQKLLFNDALSAQVILQLFEKSTNWKVDEKDSDEMKLSSIDKRYVMKFTDYSNEICYTQPPYSLFFMYNWAKGV